VTAIRFIFLAGLLAAMAAPGDVVAQGTLCNLNTLTPDRGLTLEQTPSGKINAWAGGGVRVVCRSRNITVTADSAEQWGDEGRVVMIGSVRYNEPSKLTLTSGFLTYLEPLEKVVASVDVVATLPSGATIRGPLVTFFREAPRLRPHQQVLAEAGPTVVLPQKDSAGVVTDTLTINATTLFMDGPDLMFAGGQVVISRSDLVARGDSVALDTKLETMKIMRGPIVEGLKGRKFRLTGDLIDAYSSNRNLRRVVSHGTAAATTENLKLTADTLDLRVDKDLLQHAVAWGSTRRATAVTSEQTMSADSLDVVMPGQVMRSLHAIGAAFAESAPDSTRFRTTARDWLRGDTVVALFDSVAQGDSTRSARLRSITAVSLRTDARAYYHVPASDSATTLPAITYVTGRRIALTFTDRRLALVQVRDSVSGVHLEPIANPRKPPGGGTPGRQSLPPTLPGRQPLPATSGPASPAFLHPHRKDW
jgi:hypothetical protein